MKECRFRCDICGSEYNNVYSYMECVASCGKDMLRNERKEKINASLNGIQQAKEYYKQKLEEFEKEYPEEYKLHFVTPEPCEDEDDYCKCDCNDYKKDGIKTEAHSTKPKVDKSIELLYEDDGSGSPKAYAKVNGKELDGKYLLGTLLSDPDTKHMAELLCIL